MPLIQQKPMTGIPNTLEATIVQAEAATKLALEAGYRRLQVELVIPEIDLEAQSLALQFTTLFPEAGAGLKVLFADTGAAALARRDWGDTPFKVDDLGSRFTPVETKVTPEDEAFLVVSPSAVEVNLVEKLCELAGDRPVILLIPQLEDVTIVGIGYAARQLRERFLTTLESCYYFRPVPGAIILRSFPSLWQVWLEKADGYELIREDSQKPMGESLENLILQGSNRVSEGEDGSKTVIKPKKAGLLTNMQRFLQALSQ